MDHSSMDMGSSHGDMDMGGGGACKISMLWNWTTIGACFLSPQWRIRSTGDYVGSLIGIFFAVVALEFVRRLSRDYDRSIRAAYYRREERALSVLVKDPGAQGTTMTNAGEQQGVEVAPFRPSTVQHVVRSLFYLVQFSTSYILMLLAMYFNGGVILAIFLGGAVGFALFARDTATDFEGPGARLVKGKDDVHARGECCC